MVYTFRAQARNVYGWGPFSVEMSVSATTVPAQMVPPTTAYLDGGLNVKITWTAPYTHATMPIRAYTIIIKDSLGTYRQHSSCDGTDTTIVSA